MSEAKIIESFVPQQVTGNYWTVLVETTPCSCCASPTLPRLSDGPFPRYFRVRLEEQCKRAGIRMVGSWSHIDKPICVECSAAGKERFVCACCNRSLLLSHSKESFGYPSEHLCTGCYESVPAKTWDELVKKLEDAHQYDFE